jgi:hypothetical protein
MSTRYGLLTGTLPDRAPLVVVEELEHPLQYNGELVGLLTGGRRSS